MMRQARVIYLVLPRNPFEDLMPSAALRRVLRTDPKDVHGRKISALSKFLALACLVFLQFSTGCGGGGSGSSGGGQSAPPPPPSSNPVPAIVSLSPSSATAGGAAFTLTINGNSFLASSSVQWNGSPVATTYSTSSQLQAQITAADISNSGSAAVSVINPAPGGGNSGSAEFTISATSNAVPALTSLSPSSVNAGASGFILTLNGADFVPASTIQWNGAALATTYLSGTQLEAQIPTSDIAAPGFADVVVLNPGPGGGASAPTVFTTAYAPTVVSQLANDLVWDSTYQLIYLSVPSLAASNGNTISVLNPLTGSITSSQFAGSEPNVLAVDDDDQFLYVGLDGSSSVQRYTLPGLLPDINYSLGADPLFGPTSAFDLQVAPGLPHTTAVSRGTFGSADAGMTIYDDATPRPTTTGDREGVYDSLQWGSDTTIYANNSESTGFDFYVLTVSSSGVVVSKDYPNEFSTFYISIHYDSGTNLVYTDDGYVINPSNGQHVGAFQAAGLMIPDSTLNSAFFLGQTQSQVGTTNFTIESFDLTTFAPTAEIVVPNVQGNPRHFILWGTNGLAFNDDAGFVYILNNPFVAADGSQVKTPLRYLNPVTGTKSRPKMIRPTQVVARRSGPIPKTKQHSYNSLDSNPVPTAAALSPSAVTAGVNGFTLTVTGTNFLSLSTIQWNGSQLPTEYISSSQLQAQVSASDVATAGSVSVTVVTPSPGGGTSTALPFAVVPMSSPVPVVLGFVPSFVTAGSPAFTLSVNGLTDSFDASSVVEWNGSLRPSSLYGPGQLQVQISASDVAVAGYAQITVSNPGPGGGTSNAAEFQILYQPTIVSQATNDLVWDPLNEVIYISVPSSASAHANQVCILNPVTAAIVTCQSAGSEPDVLAISDDSQYLYVGEDGTGTVQRFILPGLVPDISYTLVSSSSGGPYYALDLQVAPAAPHTTAVSIGTDTSPASGGGITIFDDSTPRPTSAAGWGPTDHSYDSIQWGSDATALYAADTESESEGFDFYTLTVSSSGVVLDQDYPNVFWNPGRIHYNSGTGLVYSNDGFHAIDPTTGLPAGILEVGGGWPLAPDSTLNTVFALDEYVWQVPSNFTIEILDMTHYTFVNRVPFSAAQDDLAGLNRFIRWGTNGLALNTAGNLYLISGQFVTGSHAIGPRVSIRPIPAHGPREHRHSNQATQGITNY
jgi:trimeric autotransporter adhesin